MTGALQGFEPIPVRPLSAAEQSAAARTVATYAADGGWLDHARDVLDMLGIGGAR